MADKSSALIHAHGLWVRVFEKVGKAFVHEANALKGSRRPDAGSAFLELPVAGGFLGEGVPVP